MSSATMRSSATRPPGSRRSASRVSDLPVAVSPTSSTPAAAPPRSTSLVKAPWYGMMPRSMAATLCSVRIIFLR